jgi:hypothetical protein
MPNRDITAQAPGESERASSELRCDEHHDRIMQESLSRGGARVLSYTSRAYRM